MHQIDVRAFALRVDLHPVWLAVGPHLDAEAPHADDRPALVVLLPRVGGREGGEVRR